MKTVVGEGTGCLLVKQLGGLAEKLIDGVTVAVGFLGWGGFFGWILFGGGERLWRLGLGLYRGLRTNADGTVTDAGFGKRRG